MKFSSIPESKSIARVFRYECCVNTAAPAPASARGPPAETPGLEPEPEPQPELDKQLEPESEPEPWARAELDDSLGVAFANAMLASSPTPPNLLVGRRSEGVGAAKAELGRLFEPEPEREPEPQPDPEPEPEPADDELEQEQEQEEEQDQEPPHDQIHAAFVQRLQEEVGSPTRAKE